MTREEVIKHFEAQGECNYAPTREAAQMAISALLVQQGSVKLDRIRWDGCEKCKDPSMSIWIGHHYNYCPYCGKPQNENSWAEMERRINGGETD